MAAGSPGAYELELKYKQKEELFVYSTQQLMSAIHERDTERITYFQEELEILHNELLSMFIRLEKNGLHT